VKESRGQPKSGALEQAVKNGNLKKTDYL